MHRMAFLAWWLESVYLEDGIPGIKPGSGLETSGGSTFKAWIRRTHAIWLLVMLLQSLDNGCFQSKF